MPVRAAATPARSRPTGPPSRAAWLGPAALAAVVTLALTFVSLELPRWLAGLAARWVDVPDLHPAIEPEAIERFLATHHLHLLGAAALAVTVALIVAGLLTRRRAPAVLGALLLWLPTFGAFAAAMFFLAGLGSLRLLWLPVWPDAMALGDIAYLPYMAVVWPLWQLGVDVRDGVTIAAIGGGLGLFTTATATWLRARWSGHTGLLTTGVYGWSRHPQYLGWIVWTYGMTLLAANEPVPMAGENPGAMLAWVISTLVIVGVALVEEGHLLAEHGATYRDYREHTGLLVPLPGAVRRILRAPLHATSALEAGASGWRLIGALGLVLAAVIVLSLPFALADWPPGPAPWATWPGW